MSSAVGIQQLRVVYGKSFEAVKNFDLDIGAGEFFGLLGPNGAGKTSVISSITGLLDVQYGSIRVFDHPAGSIEAKRLLGVVPQETVHHGFFGVEEVLHFVSGYYGIWKNSKRIDYLLDRLQLQDCRKKKVSQLSGGMKRRLSIAKALVHSPRLLLLDEPSAGVDIELRAILWEFMKELNQDGMTILLTTHYLEEAERLCGRIAIMDHGKLLALDNTRDLLFEKTQKILKLKVILQQSEIDLSGCRYPAAQTDDWIEIKIPARVSVGEVLKDLKLPLEKITDIQVEEGALEEAFLKIIRPLEGSR